MCAARETNAELQPRLLLVGNDGDGLVSRFLAACREAGWQIESVSDVYSAMAMLAKPDRCRYERVVVDERSLTRHESQFTALARQYYCDLEVNSFSDFVSDAAGDAVSASDRANHVASGTKTTVSAWSDSTFDDSALNGTAEADFNSDARSHQPFADPKNSEQRHATGPRIAVFEDDDRPTDDERPLYSDDAHAAAAECRFDENGVPYGVDEEIACDDELALEELRDVGDESSEVSIDESSDEPSLHDAVRMRMRQVTVDGDTTASTPVRRRPPGQHHSEEVPPAHAHSNESIVTPEERAALLGDDEVPARDVRASEPGR